jgi:hypothetical protein
MAEQALSVDGRPVIEPGTPIRGGVFLGRVGLVVDYEENPGPYETAYEQMDMALIDRDRESLLDVVAALSMTMRYFMPYNWDAMKAVLKREAQARDKKELTSRDAMAVSEFVPSGGSCQLQTLFALVMLEMHEEEYRLGNSLAVDILPRYSVTPTRHADIKLTVGGQTGRIITGTNAPTLVLTPPVHVYGLDA